MKENILCLTCDRSLSEDKPNRFICWECEAVSGARNHILRSALEVIAKDTVSVPCDDPQCGDSTWDHECTLGSREPSRLAQIAQQALDGATCSHYESVEQDEAICRKCGAVIMRGVAQHLMHPEEKR